MAALTYQSFMVLRTAFWKRTGPWRLLAWFGPLLATLGVEIQWERLPGKGKDISVGADGSVFIVGSGSGNQPLYRWNGTNWVVFGGGGVAVAVGPAGDPWLVSEQNNLSHFTNNAWDKIVRNSAVTDVSVGTNGTVYVVGGRSCFCGQVFNEALYRLEGTNFVDLNLTGFGIHPDPQDRRWIVNADTTLRLATGTNAATITGNAIDLDVGANGDVWIAGRNAFDGFDGRAQFWNGTAFETTEQLAVRTAVAPDGTPWITTDSDKIYRGRRVDLTVDDAATQEGQPLRFPLRLSIAASKAVSCDYRLVAPTNAVGTNSTLVSEGTVIFTPGQTNALITYTPPNDSVQQAARVYVLQLTNSVGANLRSTAATGVVTDDDPAAFSAVPTINANGRLETRIPSRLGWIYSLERRFQIGVAEDWQSVVSLSGTGLEIVLADSSLPRDAAFYRVTGRPR